MSPGYLPFKDALDLPAFFCDNCGFWQRNFAEPISCPLCIDARHVLPQSGVAVPHRARLPLRSTPAIGTRSKPAFGGSSTTPSSGIGSSGYLIQTPDGNLAFEGCAVYSDAALDRSRTSAASRCWRRRTPIRMARSGSCRTASIPSSRCTPATSPGRPRSASAGRSTIGWKPIPGLELHLTAGHFAGHTVLYDRTRRILFCGDALKFELDPANPRRAVTISAHKAFVRGIPLTPGELRRYRSVFAALDFRQTWTPFEQASNSGRREALALIDSMLSTPPACLSGATGRSQPPRRPSCAQSCGRRRSLTSGLGPSPAFGAALRSQSRSGPPN